MSPVWTKRQQAVIRHTGGDLTVSAAAGSGKTAVMVERILRLVTEEHQSLERMLVVTFTRAAASEMRQRISEALEKALERTPADAFLRRQLNRLEEAPIGTLHGYCQKLLREYGASSGLDPDFSVCDTARQQLLWGEAVEEALEGLYARPPEGFALLARGWSRYTDHGLEDLCLQLRNAYSAYPEGVQWVRRAAEDYALWAEDPGNSPWAGVLLQDAREVLEDAGEKIARAVALGAEPGAPSSYLTALACDAVQVRDLAAIPGLRDLIEALQAVCFPTIGRMKKTDDRELADEMKALRDSAKKVLQDIRDRLRILAGPAFTENARVMTPAMRALAELAEACESVYSRKKEALSLLDFSDLEHKALRLLENEAVCAEVRASFDDVFVDEYQDTNAVQEAILMRTANPGHFFCVGDAKQAIYRFRQADPALFLRRYEESSPEEGSSKRRIDLSENFRSHPGILAFANDIFRRTMSPRLGGLTYDRAAELLPGLSHPESQRTAVHLDLLTSESETQAETADEAEEALLELSRIQHQAIRAAQRIRERMGLPLWDKRGFARTAHYKDFAILLQTAKGKAEEVAATLRTCGIPCTSPGETEITRQPETGLLLSALKVIDNGDRALEWMTVMHSPLGGFSLEELLEIRRFRRDLEFPKAARAYAGGENPLAKRLSGFFSEWDALRERAAYLDVERLIWEIAEKRSWYTCLGARPGGDASQRRVRVLAQLARSLSQTRERSLYAFLRYMDSVKGSVQDEASDALITQADAVLVTTIHKSKGLEFPFVLLLGLEQPFHREQNKRLLVHDALGLAPAAFFPETHTRATTLAREAVLTRMTEESRSEKLRLLYVAVTRPREDLYLIGSVRGSGEKSFARWAREESPLDIASHTSFLDWIAPTAVRHPDAGGAGVFAKPRPAAYGMDIQILRQAAYEPAPVFQEKQSMEQDPRYEAAFLWRYPYASSVTLPGKVSVTSLLTGYTTKRSDEPSQEWVTATPAFDPRRAGTLTHSALRYIKYGQTEEEIRSLLKELAQREIFTMNDLPLIHTDWLARYAASDLARRASESERVLREAAFNLLISACRVYPEMEDCPDNLMVQGVIDLAFLEDGQWILIDYKTNRVPQSGPRALVTHYAAQLRLYRAALTEITGIPVRKSGLALLSTGKTVWLEEEEDHGTNLTGL